MTTFRLISLPTHGAYELLLGLVLMGAPFALGADIAATVVAVAVGALLVGLALGAAVAESDGIDISAHYAMDLGVSLALLGSAVVIAVAGDGVGAGLFATVALPHPALNLSTRYSAPR